MSNPEWSNYSGEPTREEILRLATLVNAYAGNLTLLQEMQELARKILKSVGGNRATKKDQSV